MIIVIKLNQIMKLIQIFNKTYKKLLYNKNKANFFIKILQIFSNQLNKITNKVIILNKIFKYILQKEKFVNNYLLS